MSCISSSYARNKNMSSVPNRTEVKGHVIAEACCSVLQPESNFSNLPKVCIPTKNRSTKRFNSFCFEDYNEDRVYVAIDNLTVYFSKVPDKRRDFTYHITVFKNKVGEGQNRLFLTVPLIQPDEGRLSYIIRTGHNVRYHEIYIYYEDSIEKRIVIKLNEIKEGNIFTQKVIPVVDRLCENNIITQFATENSTSKEYNEVSPENIASLLVPPAQCSREKDMASKNDSSGSSVPIDNKPYNLKSLTLEQMKEICDLLKTAIYSGNVEQSKQIAARLASERIKLDIEIDENSLGQSFNDVFNLSVYVEDRESGSNRPVNLKVTTKDTIKDLKLKFLMMYKFPLDVQKWIIDKKLPPDSDTLYQHKIRGPGHTAYVYLMSAKSVNTTMENFQQQLTTHMPQTGKSLTIPRNHSVPSGEYIQMNSPVKSKSFIGRPKTAPTDNTYVNTNQITGLPAALRLNSQDMMSSELSLNAYEPVETVESLLHGQTLRNSGPPLRDPGPYKNGPTTLPKPAKLIKSPEIIKPIGWTCLKCTYINIPTRPGCEICTGDRPIDYTIPTEYVLPNEERDRIMREEDCERQMQQNAEEERSQHLAALLQTDDIDLISNSEEFDCPICFDSIPIGAGVVLRECLHMFCRPCLMGAAQHSEDAELRCPYQDEEYTCESAIQEREIRALVNEELYQQILHRSLVTAESQEKHSYHCATTDCIGWCIYEDFVNFFQCPVCKKENCLTCKAIHEGKNCKQYQDDIKLKAANDLSIRRTKEYLDLMVEQGNAMLCPQCQIIVMKKDGCDWIKCSVCKTEICWVTKGRRWGPRGEGDISDGCRCGINNKPCHVNCGNCH